jgi:TonB family protein
MRDAPEHASAERRTPGRSPVEARRLLRVLPALAAAFALPAAAQPRGDIVPPHLLSAAETPWPAGEPVGETPVEVPCRVTLDATGAVIAVEVVESRGAAFDQAAVAAIRASTFAPAGQGDVAIPSRFAFRWVFTPPAPEAPPPPEPQPVGPPEPPEPPPPLEPDVTLEGEIWNEDDEPIEGAVVEVAGQGLSEPLDAVTDMEGHFYVFDLPPGRYTLTAAAAAFTTFTAEEEIVEGQTTRVLYRLALLARPFETVVRAQRPPREVTRRTIETAEIVRMPGSGGDALRVLENLPGVARPSFGLGFVVIRGSAPQNTAFYVQGVQVPLLYHFGALRSALAGDLLERIDFYPGNYSVRFGGVTGGVIDVVPRSPDREAWHGYVDLNLIDAAAFAEGPLAANASIAGGVRRSYLDAVLAGLGSVIPLDVTQAPVYWDYQLLSDWDPTPEDRVRFFVYGSDDRFAVLINDVSAGGPSIVGERSVGTSFHRFQTEWVRRFSETMENRLLVAVGYNELSLKAGGAFDATLRFLPIQLRDEFNWTLTEAFRVSLGIDTTIQWEQVRLRIPDFFGNQASGRRESLCALEPFEVVQSGWTTSPGFYLETELRPVEGLRLIPGIRFDLFRDGTLPAVDPRFTVRYEVVDGTILKAGLGSYSQPPSFLQVDARSGNPDLQAERAVHVGLGLEQQIWGNLSLQLDGFYREVGNAIVASDRQVTVDGTERTIGFENIGVTRAYGLEALLRYEPDDLFFGWLAVTLLESQSRNPRTGWRESAFDQLLNLTLVGSFDLGAGWSIGFRFRVAQGYPATPIVGAIYDADCDQYEPIPGSAGTLRLPWFHQLDLRVDKKFEWEHFALSIYLDVQNVYYQKNAEALSYNYDYTQQTYTTGLPILPALGIKGEFR